MTTSRWIVQVEYHHGYIRAFDYWKAKVIEKEVTYEALEKTDRYKEYWGTWVPGRTKQEAIQNAIDYLEFTREKQNLVRNKVTVSVPE